MNPTHTPDTSDFSRSQQLYQCLQTFMDDMKAQATPQDGVLTARVVGEFSAGKTRFLRELLGHLIPEPLFPISSLERQTRLQLEITYGETPELTLIERAEDYHQATTLKHLSQFPSRDDVMAFDPAQYRLRLAINEPQLVLHQGDGFSDDANPKRLFLIDTPGWNSGDDVLAERDAASILTGYHNLALIYISQAARLDGELNASHLKDFLQALSEADFLDQTRLIFVVSSCPPKEAQRFQQRARQLVLKLWQELGNDADDLGLDVYCVDFHDMPADELQAFRQKFWGSLLGSTTHNSKEAAAEPWVAALQRWPDDWNVWPLLASSFRMLDRFQSLLQLACKDGEFVAGMNMYRLLGLNEADLRKKVLSTWLKQLGCEAQELGRPALPKLPEGHPLSVWWQDYWIPNLERSLLPVQAFFLKAQQVMAALTPDIPDLNLHLSQQLDYPYVQALRSAENSFTCLVKTIQQLQTEPASEKRLATLFTLSMLQARYEDYYAQHKQQAQRLQ